LGGGKKGTAKKREGFHLFLREKERRSTKERKKRLGKKVESDSISNLLGGKR